ncbi:MAG TPA: PepSY-associated TM helix domain-containing protein [Vicinamibacterales bacterium]|nr:PepSY-associated TM helix domain-containing protein [Vicinamibacterales bacterium]
MLYRWLRDLHLYFGLFISPFILLFAASVFYLNHGKLIVPTDLQAETHRDLQVPEGFDRLKGPEAVARARQILPQVGVAGEIGFLRYVRNDRHLIFPVTRAGYEAMVDVDLDARTATVKRRAMGMWESIAYLHKMPGPHNVAIRGNWVGTQSWRVVADATIYLLLFVSVSGVYLWFAVKAERRIGLALLGAGAVTFFGLIAAILHG